MRTTEIILVQQYESWGDFTKTIGAFKSIEDANFWIDMEKMKQDDEFFDMLKENELAFNPFERMVYKTEQIKLFYTNSPVA